MGQGEVDLGAFTGMEKLERPGRGEDVDAEGPVQELKR